MQSTAISDVRCPLYRLPMRSHFTTAHGVLASREGAIVEVITHNGVVGLGELAPLPAFGGESLTQALTSLALVARQIRGREPDQALALLYALKDRNIPAATICGLESALLDLIGQVRNKSVGELLETGLPPTRVPVNAVVGAPSMQDAQKEAQEAVRAGFRCIKLKMGHGVKEQIQRVAAVREALGPALHLRLDANEGWSFEEAYAILTGCESLAIQYIEQPLPANDLAGMRKLREMIAIPVAADEAVHSLESTRQVLAAEAADLLIVKPQLAGGLQASRQIISEAAAHGVQCVVTSMLEAGVGIAGALHLAAASPEVTLECGLATLPLLVDDLLLNELPIQDGWMPIPIGAGLGVRLDRGALEKYKLYR